MNAELLKRADWLVTTTLLALYPIAKLARLMRRRLGSMAIVRPGGMGDLICLEMAAEQLGPLGLQESLVFLDYRSSAWASYRGLNHVRYDSSPLWTLLCNMGRFEKVLVSEQRFGSAAAYGLLLSGSRLQTSGFATQTLARLLGAVVPYDPVGEHEVSSFARLLAAEASRVSPGSESRREPTRFRIREVASDDLWICVAGRGVPSREIEAKLLADFALKMVGPDRGIRICSQPSDRAYASELQALLPNASKFEGSFAALCDALSGASEVLTVDGGMVHVASFFGVPTTALFTAGIVGKWHPLGSGSRVVVVDEALACRPCTRFGQVPACPIQYQCKQFGKYGVLINEC